MKETERNGSSVSYDDIAVGAYHLWEAAGRPEGRAVEHWLQAEARLRARGGIEKGTGTTSEPAEASGPGQARKTRYGLVLKSRVAASG